MPVSNARRNKATINHVAKMLPITIPAIAPPERQLHVPLASRAWMPGEAAVGGIICAVALSVSFLPPVVIDR